MRAPKSIWTLTELNMLRYLIWTYGSTTVDYYKVSQCFQNRSPCDVKKRYVVIRDGDRRKIRQKEYAQREYFRALREARETYHEEYYEEYNADVEYVGKLHHSLIWVATRNEVFPLHTPHTHAHTPHTHRTHRCLFLCAGSRIPCSLMRIRLCCVVWMDCTLECKCCQQTIPKK